MLTLTIWHLPKNLNILIQFGSGIKKYCTHNIIPKQQQKWQIDTYPLRSTQNIPNALTVRFIPEIYLRDIEDFNMERQVVLSIHSSWDTFYINSKGLWKKSKGKQFSKRKFNVWF